MAADIGAALASLSGVVAGADLVIVSIPSKAIPALAPTLTGRIAEAAVVIDTCNYHPELRDGRIDAIENGMLDTEWVAQQLGRPVIKAFNNILATSLRDRPSPPGGEDRVALPVAGDGREERAVVLELVDELGFDPVDAGVLADSWRQQPGAPAYLHDYDAALLRRALAAAERSMVAQYCAREEERIRRSLPVSAPTSATAEPRPASS